MTQLSDKLSVKEKIGYAMGDVASNLFWMVFVFFGMYFYTDLFGLSAAAVGTMFGVTRLVDAIIEPSIGLLSDRTRTRWGQFRPYLLWVAVPFGVIGALAGSWLGAQHISNLNLRRTLGVIMSFAVSNFWLTFWRP